MDETEKERFFSEETYLDGCLRPWGRTPKPQVEDPWNWIPDWSNGKLSYLRVRRGPKPPADTWPSGPPATASTREQRAGRYAGRYFSRPDGSGLFRALRGATGAVLLTIRPDDTRGLTDPDELEALLLSGTLVARPDVTPPDNVANA
jgi:hypothetical protein